MTRIPREATPETRADEIVAWFDQFSDADMIPAQVVKPFIRELGRMVADGGKA